MPRVLTSSVRAAVVLPCAALLAAGLAAALPVESAWEATHRALVAAGDSAMVVSASPIATRIGIDVLRRGGNAMDATVAVAFALAVAYPTAGNIGGGGFIVTRMGDTLAALDFREVAPGAATRDMYLDSLGHVTDRSLVGALAAGVPGSVAGLWEAHRRFGSRPWRELLAPAIALARDGFAVDEAFIEGAERRRTRFARFPSTAAIYLPGGAPVPLGGSWRNPDLARTLGRIAREGRDGFYRGRTAALVADEMARSGGIVTRDDLDAYEPVWREPVRFDYRGHHVVSMPPTSSGGLTIALVAGILEGLDLRGMGWHSARAVHAIAAAERLAFARRNSLLGDPAFVPVPLASFLSPDTAAALRASIVGGAHPAVAPDPVHGNHTTHISIVDARGNAVAMTTTLNTGYGSSLVVSGAGFLLNNEMDDFTTAVGAVNAMGLRQGEANAIAPGKRMLSSMMPTIVLDAAGAPEMVAGASGGARIITAVAQCLLDAYEFEIPLGRSMAAPRFHAQDYPDSLFLEQGGFAAEVLRELQGLGDHPAPAAAWGDGFGWLQVVRRTSRGWEGVSEPRARGLAAGY